MFNDKTNKFLAFLSIVTRKPETYSVKNVEDISLIIFAYTCGANDWEDQQNLLNEFQEYMSKKLELENFSWSKLVRLYAGSDAHSIELFVTLFGRFLLENYGFVFPLPEQNSVSNAPENN